MAEGLVLAVEPRNCAAIALGRPPRPRWPRTRGFICEGGGRGRRQILGEEAGTFGSSAPLKDLMKKFGFTPERVLEAAQQQLAKRHDPAQTA